MSWINVTDLNGNDAWINTAHIVRVREPQRDAPGAGAHIDMLGGWTMAVQETIKGLAALLKESK
jgi:uncharacterized protein YlzI (FlbEa/FlbD family)